MSIRAVFRVRCDGPCKGWLSLSPEFAGRDILPGMMTVEPTAVHACNWPGERAARRGAFHAGWKYVLVPGKSDQLMCPPCAVNPLGIVLPPDPVCICTHPLSQHNFQRLCIALPGTIGCGCLGFLRKEDWRPGPACGEEETPHAPDMSGVCVFCERQVVNE